MKSILFLRFAIAAIVLLMSGLPSRAQVNTCESFLKYTPDALTPVKIVRVNVHVMQRADGSGNFGDSPQGRAMIEALFAHEEENFSSINRHMFGLVAPPTWTFNNPETGAPYPYITDTRIRFRLMGIYFHQNDTGFTNNGNRFNSWCFRNFAVNQESEINIFFCTINGPGSLGLANSVILDTDLKDPALLVPNAEGHYPLMFNFAKLLGHELGHSLSLVHTGTFDPPCKEGQQAPRGDDGLADTPAPDRNNWEQDCPRTFGPVEGCGIPSNNVMGYNKCRNYFSPMQMAKMHQYLNGAGKRFLLDPASDSVCAGTIHPNITDSLTIWNYPRRRIGSFSIPPGCTLIIRCRTEMTEASTITVRPGGRLVLDGAVLTRSCGQKNWSGILLNGNRRKRHKQGLLDIKAGSVIEFAETPWKLVKGGKVLQFPPGKEKSSP